MTDPHRDSPADLFRAAQDHARDQAAPPDGLPGVAELQARFQEFEVLGLIGRGGMGAVYKARDPKLDRLVALKILPPHLQHDPSFAERFAREARTLARLQHPHVLTVFDYGERDGLPFLVTEFVEGLDLRRLMAAEKLDPAEALRIVPQICDALQFAHEHGVVHRDIKPENVLIDTRGHVKVADFGLAKILGADAGGPALTATHHAPGTVHYTAPEALRGLAVDHRADIYGLGVLLYELLTGHVPVGHFRPPSERAGTERRLDAIVARALRDEPEDRYQHVSEIRSDLARPTGTARPTDRGPSGAGATAAAPAARRRWGTASILLTTLAVLFVAYIGLVVYARLILAATPPPQPSILSLAGLGVIAVISTIGFRRMREVRESGEPHGATGAVCLAWLPILIPASGAVLAFVPELSDRDGTRILQVAIGAALVILDAALLAALTRMLRADTLRRSGTS